MITFCLTSCGRQDLLERTLDSFLKFNTHPIDEYIIIEDSGSQDCNRELAEKYYHKGRFQWLYNPERIGMVKSIDRLYSMVNPKTDYIFHCEDDWEFYRPGFIEKSLDVLEDAPHILQVWLREIWDTNGHPVLPSLYRTKSGMPVSILKHNYQGVWSGYSTNPGLRRYKDIINFNALSVFGPDNIGLEAKISMYYAAAGFSAVILTEGYVRHIGEGRSKISEFKGNI